MANILNALGDACPIPVIKAKNALKTMSTGEQLVISVDNVIATENLTKMAKELGCESSINKIGEEHFEVAIVKGEAKESAGITPITYAVEDNTVIAIGSDLMGTGEEELGRTLLKGFIYAVTELDRLPKTILFYNSGAKVSIQGSAILEDLQKLEEKGVEILTCGTCLNYYNIAEKLAVGSVTNMYTILEKLANASKVIKP